MGLLIYKMGFLGPPSVRMMYGWWFLVANNAIQRCVPLRLHWEESLPKKGENPKADHGWIQVKSCMMVHQGSCEVFCMVVIKQVWPTQVWNPLVLSLDGQVDNFSKRELKWERKKEESSLGLLKAMGPFGSACWAHGPPSILSPHNIMLSDKRQGRFDLIHWMGGNTELSFCFYGLGPMCGLGLRHYLSNGDILFVLLSPFSEWSKNINVKYDPHNGNSKQTNGLQAKENFSGPL